MKLVEEQEVSAVEILEWEIVRGEVDPEECLYQASISHEGN